MATTLAQLKQKVRLRYARSGSATDPGDSLLLVYINYALRHIYNKVGDTAWFLRKTGEFAVNGKRQETLMPANVRRLYRLELESLSPGRDIDWRLLRYDADRALVIETACPGTFTGHFLDIPVDLVLDADVMALPDEHVELAVMLACRRIAISVGNIAFSQSLLADLPRLWKNLKRDMGRYAGQRHEGMRSSYYQDHPSLPW
jgi:hypothetical protein